MKAQLYEEGVEKVMLTHQIQIALYLVFVVSPG